MEYPTDKHWWDDVHRSMWRLPGNLSGLQRSARRVASESVAPLVAFGGRSTYSWTDAKARVLQALDDAGLTSIVTNSAGRIAMPLAVARGSVRSRDREEAVVEMRAKSAGQDTSRVTMPLAVTAWELAWIDGGAAVCSLSSLAHMIIGDAGTEEQRLRYLDNPDRRHGALCLTEPVPGAGADAASIEGRIRVAEWAHGQQPKLEVEKRGHFTSHMDFAEFVVAAVDSRDPRIRGSCIVILEPGDAGLFNRGVPVRKLGHELSSTTNPEFRLLVPADRILGGYNIEANAIVPKRSHREALAATFRRARVLMSLLTASKILSVVAPSIAACRRSGGEYASLPQVVDIWAAGEAAASLGFCAARISDDLDSAAAERSALERLAAVVCPAAKLFSTERASAVLPIAADIIGKFCTFEAAGGFVGYKLIDAQLEAVYLGPEAVQRRQISAFMIDPAFLTQFAEWTREMRHHPWTGAVNLAAAMELWSWTLDHLRHTRDSRGAPGFREARQAVTFPLADALGWLLAARSLVLDVLTLQADRPPGSFYRELAAIHSAQAAGRVAQVCTGLLFGYHPQVAFSKTARHEFAALRAGVDASVCGAMLVRQRAIEFIRELDLTALGYPY